MSKFNSSWKYKLYGVKYKYNYSRKMIFNQHTRHEFNVGLISIWKEINADDHIWETQIWEQASDEHITQLDKQKDIIGT